MKALAVAVLLALFAAPVAAATAGEPQPRMSGVWAVFQIVTASGRRAMADPPMSKQGEATVGASAASMAGGVVANFGTMTKPLHVGLGARNGVLAAKLAQAGFTANGKAIESGFGFYKVLHPGTAIDAPNC